jgi:hypothetical protein
MERRKEENADLTKIAWRSETDFKPIPEYYPMEADNLCREMDEKTFLAYIHKRKQEFDKRHAV